MFKAKYLIRLDENIFPGDLVVCLASQLESVLNTLREFIEPQVWFCADVSAFSPIPKKLGIDSFQLKKIGDVNSLINLCENINQFLSGVFVAIKEKNKNFKYSDVLVGTEDERFRSLECEGVLMEIRAFDTSYFELYSDDIKLMEKLSKIYKTRVVTEADDQ